MHVKIRKRIGNPTLYNAKINYSHVSKVMFYQIELMIYLLILVNGNKFLLISGKL